MDNKIVLSDASYDLDPKSETYKQWKFEDDLHGLIQVFTCNIDHAFGQYQKDNNWITLADSLWENYRNLFFRESKGEHSPEQERLIFEQKKSADAHFQAAFKGSMNHLHDLHPKHAALLLNRLREYLIEERDFKEFGSAPFTDDEKQKYTLFIRRIDAEIRTHQDRQKLQQLVDAKIIESPKGIKTEELPAWDRSKQKAHALGFIRRNLTVPDNHEGSKEDYIKHLYKTWKQRWLKELEEKHGLAFIEQNESKILKHKGFRYYFFNLKG